MLAHSAPMFQVVPLTEAHCRDICTWSYPVPYNTYNWQPWEMMLTQQYEFADERLREEQYRAVVDKDGLLWGFAQLFPIVGVTRIGLGMRPELCGQGHGVAFVQSIAAEAKRKEPANEIDLEVLAWNIRAYRVYQQAGFVQTDTYTRTTTTGKESFYCMVWQPKKR
jgi:ribosomal-protein-alanine N-acetyltransferase